MLDNDENKRRNVFLGWGCCSVARALCSMPKAPSLNPGTTTTRCSGEHPYLRGGGRRIRDSSQHRLHETRNKKGNNLFLELYKCLVMEFLGCYNSGQIGVNIVFNYKKKTILNRVQKRKDPYFKLSRFK